jgi:hypothetical protein
VIVHFVLVTQERSGQNEQSPLTLTHSTQERPEQNKQSPLTLTHSTQERPAWVE